MPKRALFIFALLCSLNLSLAEEATDLASGIKLYWDAKYKEAAVTLKNVKPADLSPQERVLLFKFLGLTLFARGDKASAEEAFIEVLMIDPEYKLAEPDFSGDVVKCFRRSRTKLSNRLSDRGLKQYRLKDYWAAEADFHQALAIDPSNPIAKDFLPLVIQPEEIEERPTPLCKPTLVWGSLDTRNGQCSGADVSSSFDLPVTANKLTMVYAVHHSGAGQCWKIVLYDEKGEIIHAFEDPKREFAANKAPEPASRWQVVELSEERTVAKVMMYSAPSPVYRRILSKDIGKNLLDTFLLGFEVVCNSVNE